MRRSSPDDGSIRSFGSLGSDLGQLKYPNDVLLDEDEISGVLEERGKLSGLIPGYEPRKSQIKLTRDVTSAFNQRGVLAAEAGTGVGKSFGGSTSSLVAFWRAARTVSVASPAGSKAFARSRPSRQSR